MENFNNNSNKDAQFFESGGRGAGGVTGQEWAEEGLKNPVIKEIADMQLSDEEIDQRIQELTAKKSTEGLTAEETEELVTMLELAA